MDFYKSNMDLLKIKDIHLYNDMNQFILDEKTYKKELTHSKVYTLRISDYDYVRNKNIDFYLHSKYDPIKEAEKFADSQYSEQKENIIIFGFGLGYHIEAILNKLKGNQELYVFEMNFNIFEAALECRNLSNILSDDKVHLMISDNEKKLALNLGNLLKKDVKLIIYPPSLKTIPKGSENIRFILEDWNITKSETDEWRERVDENYERNKALNVPSVGGLYNRYKGLPFIIVSAGPSLEKNIHLLSDLEGRAFIFAVGRTLKTLLWENIEPDMFCIIDPQYEPTYSQISGYENLDIPMVFFESASADTISKYKGPKYIASDKKEHVENPEHIMDLGGSVATAILDLSIRFGGNPIVFVGQDLAFTDGQSHAYGNTVNESTNRRKVKGQNGEWLDTTLGLLSFKHWIENKIKDNPQIEFINATEGGAFIEGCKHMPLQNFIDQYIDYSKPVDQRLRQRKFKEEIKIFTATIEFIE
ncbi:motility associated factor glycosyltransferase family protein [Defluviitalea saccharophila]|uniref:DUF115 domain-containing protein n=1 Tax=Defluviitalea saccharophila TaxID=879970 RepID=A0ABZ2Y0Q8_9FIRM